ncbi:putative glycoprotein [Hubei dimarhabdovirus 1]|uniref:Putative glycoprotein n=1 Tax=Hubei dimarhabdovirus 1 TaxID=2849739 RepID=A0A1L3KN00_9RHAB|nr:putative glycoprotein [Hubei dimarhabdovirus 1]APG78743.1 putative glycoprotein [Hubei dimarhabdovirus 1]
MNSVKVNFLFLLSSISPFIPITQSITFTFPILTNPTWTETNPYQLECPQTHHTFNPETHRVESYVLALKPRFASELKVNGFLCKKIRKWTKCTETPWFTKSTQRGIEYIPVSASSCEAGLTKYMHGEEDSSDFPKESCNWASSNTENTEALTLTPHSVHLDPYSSKVVDPIFPGGLSEPRPSETIHKNILWIPIDMNPFHSCAATEKYIGVIYSNSDFPTTTPLADIASLHIDGHKDKPFKGSCKINYCGRSGIRFTDGEWVSLEYFRNQSINQEQFIRNLPSCASDTIIRIQSPQSDTDEDSELTINLLYRLKCQETISKIIEKSLISPYDISFLAQSYPGPGPVFLLDNGHVLQTYGNYIEISQTDRTSGEDGYLGINTLTKARVYNTIWRSDPSDKLMKHGPNGLISYNRTIHLQKGLVTRSFNSRMLLTTQHLSDIPHESLQILSNYTKAVGGSLIQVPTNATNLGDAIINTVENVFDRIGYIQSALYSISGLIIIYIIIKCILKLRLLLCSVKPKPKQTNSRSTDLEMDYF